MESFVRRLALALLVSCCAAGAHAQVVISQVYGGGGNSGATLRSDFIELHNNGTTAASLTGWSVQYASSTGTNWQVTPLSGTIPAGGYYLVKQADGAGGTVDLPTPDGVGSIAMAAGAGKVALVSSTTPLSGSCPPITVDFVPYGFATNCLAPTATLSATLAARRHNGGCMDSGNSAVDFEAVAPDPRNSASAAFVCDVAGTPPNLTITDVALNEGDDGTTLFTFTANLSRPAEAGGVNFYFSTANGNATAGSDYTQTAGQHSIPFGQNSARIYISVIGDTAPEPDEVFYVNIHADSVQGATLVDGQGAGTIINDDGIVPFVSISDASAAEGDSGTTPFFFTLSLDRPAGAGGVSVDWATADGTATAGSDYAAAGGTATIAEGTTSVTIAVDVLGDTDGEADETFVVDLSNPVGAEFADAQGTGTILNDDIDTVAIAAIQGEGQLSPYDGVQVATTGIVTGRKNNGFFIQTPDAEADGNAATSEGLFVFTSAAPPAAAAVGTLVLVQGTVDEYVPAADPHQLPMTELVNVTAVTALSGGHALPAAVALTTDLPNANDGLDQLERFEGMRVVVPSATVVAPTGGNVNETQATATSNGRFAVVVTGVARPFREAGIPTPNPDPLGSSATDIPRWDFNPELIAVNSATIGAPAANVAAGCLITDGTLVGPLDYTFRRYTIYPEAALAVDCSQTGLPRPSQLPSADDVSFATWNVERLFDDVNDPAIGEPVVASAAYQRRLAKASLAIRDYLHAPDVVGVVEVENLTVLQALADRINADAVAASQPDPGYVGYLVEGNDVGGIDVGFLVKTAEVAAGTPRVEVVNVVQHGAAETLANPDGSTSLLNDRPPLLLNAIAHFADGRQLRFMAVVVHQRSLNDVDNDEAGSNGWLTVGQRVRAKRHAQAEYLAELINLFMLDDGDNKIVVMGDFNAFQFNDGLVDALGTTTGLPSPDAQTAVDGDGVPVIYPPLHNLTLLADPAERYSFVFDYQAQTLDHVLVNDALVDSPLVTGLELSHARINADFPETARNEDGTPSRLSDHDPTVLLVRLAAVAFADLSITAQALEDTVPAGDPVTFLSTVTNLGGGDAAFPGVGFVLDEEVPDLIVFAPGGWTCESPVAAEGTTTVACNSEALPAGGEATFQLALSAPASLVGEQLTLTAATTSQTEDPDPENNDAQAAVLVEDPYAGIPVLENGVSAGGNAGDAGGEVVYRIEVPAGASNLRVLSFGGSGDVTLYVARDRIPTAGDYDGRSQRPGNNETVAVAAPQPGTWFVKLVGVRAFRNVSVRASYGE